MTDETNTPRTGGIIHPPEAIRDATARLRAFLNAASIGGGIFIGTEDFHFDTADLITVLDALDACTAPARIIDFPAPLTEQQYEELKAKWRETHMAFRPDIRVEWVGPPADGDSLLKQVRRWIRVRPGGGPV